MEVSLKGITKVFRSRGTETVAVDDVSVKIPSGEFFFLLGPSGCGKTTLLRAIAGLLVPTAGKVVFGSTDVTHMSVEKRNTAMVFQSYALWPHMTVAQNVEFGPKMRRVGRRERRRIAGEQLTRVQMEEFARRRPNQLSGGQQQRVSLARALAAGADLLLLDEPLSNLDAQLRLHMRGELRKLVKASGTTAIYVTHDQKEALSMADRIAVMDQGHIVQVGAALEIYNSPANRFVADFLGEANFIEGKVVALRKPVRVDTAFGPILARETPGIEADSEVTCCVRPENIGISLVPGKDIGPQSFSLPAIVESSVYLGEMCQYTCSLGPSSAGARWKVSAIGSSAATIQVGQHVSLSINSRDVTLLKR